MATLTVHEEIPREVNRCKCKHGSARHSDMPITRTVIHVKSKFEVFCDLLLGDFSPTTEREILSHPCLIPTCRCENYIAEEKTHATNV